MKTLNTSQPYGVVEGDTEGRRFHQDGTYFDGDGAEHGAPARKRRPDPVADTPIPADTLLDDQVSKQI